MSAGPARHYGRASLFPSRLSDAAGRLAAVADNAPGDRMDLDRTPAQIANSAAEELRALNHRTLDPRAYTQPADLSDVVDALTTLVQRMPQALTQAGTALRVQEERGAIRLNYGNGSQKELVSAFVATLTSLQESSRLLGQAHKQLRDAAGRMSHMGGYLAEANDEEEEPRS